MNTFANIKKKTRHKQKEREKKEKITKREEEELFVLFYGISQPHWSFNAESSSRK